MQDLNKILSSLSPEKRALLEKKLLKDAKKYNSFPLSFAQKRLWFLDQLQPGSTAYNIPVAMKLNGELCIKSLEKGINTIIQRHEVLRSRFVTLNDTPMQTINNNFKFKIDYVNFKHIPSELRDSELKSALTENSKLYFSLDAENLFKIILFKCSENEHVLQIVMHHIISDGWSVGIFMKEFSLCYDAYRLGTEPILPKLTIQYADFAKWQSKWIESQDFKDQLLYWKKNMDPLPEALELPTDYKRQPIRRQKGNSFKSRISLELYHEAKKLANKEGISLFMLTLAVFKIILHKISGKNDITVGTPIANRNKNEIENLLGFFVNTLVLRTTVDANKSFLDLLKDIRQTALNSFDHQDMPFEKLVEELHPSRNMSQTPLFQVMFVYQGGSDGAIELNSLKIEPVEMESFIAKFDLTLSISESSTEGLGISIEYDTDLFTESTIQRFISHYKKCLSEILLNPESKIYAISLLSESDLTKILTLWNNTGVLNNREECFHELFESQVEKNPNQLAVQFKGQKITYADLDKKSNKLANYLIKKNVKPENIVGLLLDKSIEMIVAILAVLKSGAGYLPLDPSYPGERLSFMLIDSGAQLVITNNKEKSLLNKTGVTFINIDIESELIENESIEKPLVNVNLDNVAYVIYTSGSTGNPKGTIITHSGIGNLSILHKNEFNINGESKVLQFSSFSFDASVWEIIMALLNGATLQITDRDDIISGSKLIDVISEYQTTIMTLPPAMLSILPETKLPNLKTLITAGESVSSDLINKWSSEQNFINAYGPTEATICASMFYCNDNTSKNTPIGKPIYNIQLHVLDLDLNPTPIGIPGELYICSKGLARGYFNRPGLTAEKFVPNPFSENEGSRFYRTGDRVKYLEDGNIEFIERIDSQIKLRGFRIELGEIEVQVKSLNEVEDAVVIVKENSNFEKYLVAFYVSSQINFTEQNYLKDRLRKNLPDYMIPAFFIKIDKIPITQNGKIDRKNLGSLSIESHNYQNEYIAPSSASEETLCNIFSQVLDISRIGVNHNFFEMGGHSLLATKCISRIRESFGIDVPLNILFEYDNIQSIATYIDRLNNDKKQFNQSPIPIVSRTNNIPLSFAQERLWFLDQLDPSNSVYNIPSVVKIHGKLIIDRFEESLNIIIQRHEILRTLIQTVDGQAFQNIVNDFKTKVGLIDLTDLSIKERNLELLDIIRYESNNPFQLEVLPLLRALLVKTGDDEFVLVLTMHHIISDGWSIGIFVSEFSHIYTALTNNSPINLPPLKIQYADYADWQRKWLKDGETQKQLEYWDKQLYGIQPLLNLSTDRPRPSVQTFTGALRKFVVDSTISEQISKMAKDTNVTVFMVLIAALNILLYRYSGQNDICIGTPIANRNRLDLENLIGFFINTIVIRTDLSNCPTFLSLLKTIKETSLEAFNNQDLPFEKLIDSLEIKRDASHSPIFQVMFTYQNIPKMKISLSEITLEQIELDSQNAKFDINITMSEMTNGNLAGAFEFNTDLFDSSTIERMIEHYTLLLEALVKNPKQSVEEYTFINNLERKILLSEWNKSSFCEVSFVSPIELFENTVDLNPQRNAVVYKNEKLSFNELNIKANRLSYYILTSGCKCEDIVGVCLDRSLDMIVTIIAIWKAGCAYVPIDPHLPLERVEYILRDSGCRTIVTSTQILNKYSEVFSNHILVDSKEKAIGIKSIKNPSKSVSGSNLAYVIYTSGSTGIPKGVMVENKSLMNLAHELNQNIYNSTNDKIISLNAQISFDASIQQIVMMLFGNTLNIIPNDLRLDGELLSNYIIENSIEVLDCVPTQLKLLIENNLLKNSTWKPKIILPGGEAIGNELWTQICESKEIKFCNMYGPTECTVDSTICLISDDKVKPSIGRPILNSTHYILDQNINPVPIGVTGELYIGAIVLSRGYLNNASMTAEKFIPDPFSDLNGGRLYKTGDLVRYLADGNIEYLGRVDHQIKLRGYRIELDEIEILLNGHPTINQSVVIVREDSPGIKKIVGYCVPKNGDSLQTVLIRDYLQSKLPGYMIPSQFVEMKKLPLTKSGKINRNALPEPDISKVEVSANYVEPNTENEIILCNAVEEVLGIQKVGVHDNFFELGGDSIIGIQVIAKAKQAGISISPVQLFQHQTIYKLAAIAVKAKNIRAEQGIISGPLNFIPIQKAFIDEKYQNQNHWNQSILFKVNIKLNKKLLIATIKKLANHHDSLRIRISEHKNQDMNILPELDDKVFEFLDLSNEMYSNDEFENICTEFQRSLELIRGPLFKVIYMNFGNNGGRLLFIFHHMLIDGVSWRIFLEDFQFIYQSLKHNIDYNMPLKTTSFKEWSNLLLEYSKTPNVQNETEYWIRKSRLFTNAQITDFDNGINSEASSRTISQNLDEENTNNLLTVANKKYNTKIDELLLTALILSYSKWSGKRSIFVNMEGHGRNHIYEDIDLSRTIGWFTTIYPVHLELKKAISISDSVNVIKEQIREIPNAGLGYGLLRHLIDDCELREELSVFDDVNITFNYLGQFDQILKSDSIFEPAIENKGVERALENQRNNLIDISANVSAGKLRILFTYCSKLFKEESLLEWINLYIKSLTEIIEDCTTEEKVSYSSSDFELSNLSNKKLNKVLDKLKRK